MQNDPIGNDGGCLNWYLYVANNPVNYTDVMGLMGSKPPNCCDDEALRNRIRFVRNIIRSIHNGNISEENYQSSGEVAAGTICVFGMPITTYYKPYYDEKDECIKECIRLHESVHGRQCRKQRDLYFSNELEAWLEELVCLINKLTK